MLSSGAVTAPDENQIIETIRAEVERRRAVKAERARQDPDLRVPGMRPRPCLQRGPSDPSHTETGGLT